MWECFVKSQVKSLKIKQVHFLAKHKIPHQRAHWQVNQTTISNTLGHVCTSNLECFIHLWQSLLWFLIWLLGQRNRCWEQIIVLHTLSPDVLLIRFQWHCNTIKELKCRSLASSLLIQETYFQQFTLANLFKFSDCIFKQFTTIKFNCLLFESCTISSISWRRLSSCTASLLAHVVPQKVHTSVDINFTDKSY